MSDGNVGRSSFGGREIWESTNPGQVANGMRRRVAQPRVAEIVADELRGRIMSGALADGELLPKLDDLLEEFPISKPSIREAMRILETEGLISVRRGKFGGAVVHSPKITTAAYMVGLVLQSQAMTLQDVSDSLSVLEPACIRLVVERDDAAVAVVPVLEENCEEAARHLEDGPRFTRLQRVFHNRLVRHCPVRPLVVLVGVLEALWSAQEVEWADQIEAAGDYPTLQLRRESMRAHEEIVEAIRSGDSTLAERRARQHVRAAHAFALEAKGGQVVSIVNSRTGFKVAQRMGGSKTLMDPC